MPSTPWNRRPFDVVLMDVQMPEMDGLAATAAIRASEQVSGGHVPIVGMTAHALKGDREVCLEAGMDEYVAKPIRADQLFAAIEAVIPKSAESPLPALRVAPGGRRRLVRSLPGRAGQSNLAGHDRRSGPGRNTPPENVDRTGRDRGEFHRFASCGAYAQGIVALLRRGRGRSASAALGTNGAATAICAARPRPCGCSMPRRKRLSAACPSICSRLTSSLEPTEMPGGSIGRRSARSTWS